MIANGHQLRALLQEQEADTKWEQEHGEKIELLHEIDRRAGADEITNQQRRQMIERLFPGFPWKS